ncbi:MAG: hypothetical protein M0D57_09090 [Sphingobacteriales bacterium JAD_PAG50586_3]|nr:MAG: hypothetical protein M0D57_09090 [Sphingobacteriales bacterium JAD_PAG50586_3]
MKHFRLLTLTSLALSLVLASCSVEKRHYNKGYNVDWNAKAPKATEKSTTKPPTETAIKETTTQPTVNNTQPAQTTPVATQTAKAPAKTTKKENKQKVVVDTKADNTQSASASDDIDTKATVRPYDFKVQEGVDVAKVKAKPLAFISKMAKAAEGSDILAILAFIFGILALFTYYASFLLALAAIILGAIAMGRTSGTMHLLALLGLIFGIVAIFLWIGLFVFVL